MLKRFPFSFFLLLILIDQAAKYLAYNKSYGSFLNSLRPIFGFEIFPNVNLAFSIRLPAIAMWTIYLVLLAVLAVWFARQKIKTRTLTCAFALILAGAISNIIDRLWLGYVRDFIFVFWGNVFNLADVFIVFGILILLFSREPGQP